MTTVHSWRSSVGEGADDDAGHDAPFKVQYAHSIDGSDGLRERGQPSHGLELYKCPFILDPEKKSSDLDLYYKVTPEHAWDRITKNNNFLVNGIRYSVGNFVYVNRVGSRSEKPESFWVAKILKIRGDDPQHIYALVAWLYWAKELPLDLTPGPCITDPNPGKQPYHGCHELIGSNYLDVISLLTFAGIADVSHWREDDGGQPPELFWRQTFNWLTKQLSEVKQRCVCHGYCNPDSKMFICGNKACGIWFHPECLIKNKMRTYDAAVAKDENNQQKLTESDATRNKSGSEQVDETYHLFEATILDNEERSPAFQITYVREEPYAIKTAETPVTCPKCNFGFD
ncbi:hypothetical protein F5884DRAFT_143264 [Xylogone sp. PMI_703]|nr:hypothetical protein F5884DRAFT_143264 [Xylogone sp. PMI_703]